MTYSPFPSMSQAAAIRASRRHSLRCTAGPAAVELGPRRCSRPLFAVFVLGVLLPSPPAAAHLAEFERDTAAWTAFAPGWKALAFDELYPGIAEGTGCLSPDGPLVVPLDGGAVTLELSGGTSAVFCPIRDGSGVFGAVSDAILDQGQTLAMTFDPPIHGFYTFHSSVAEGAVVTTRLFSADGRIAGYEMVGTVGSPGFGALGVGHGFVSTVAIERLEISSSETGATVIGAFVGLAGGEPSLGGAGDCGGFLCDFGYAYTTSLPTDRLVTYDPDAFVDDFGWAVDLSGDQAVVGAPAHTGPNNTGFGAAYVFRRVTAGADALWALVEKLAPTPAISTSRFGESVAIDGDTVIVGAPRTQVGAILGAGAVHVFERNAGGAEQWSQTKRLLPLTATEQGGFGAAVALDGEVLLVGEPRATFSFLKEDEGAVAVHERNLGGQGQWGRRKILTQDFSSSSFGASIAMRGGLAIVGAPTSPLLFEDDPREGVARLYGRNEDGADSWGELMLFNGSIAPDDFGAAVAVDGNIVAIGAPLGETGGVVWIWQKNPEDPWTNAGATFVTAPDPAAGDRFGDALALDGITLFAGAPELKPGAGSVYRLIRIAQGQWPPMLVPPPAAPAPRYGFAVAFEASSGRLLVGSPRSDAAFFPFASLVIFATGFETKELSEWSH